MNFFLESDILISNGISSTVFQIKKHTLWGRFVSKLSSGSTSSSKGITNTTSMRVLSPCIGESGKYRLADVGYVGIRSASSYTYITYFRISVLPRLTNTHGHNTLIEVLLVIPLQLLAPPELSFDTNLPHWQRKKKRLVDSNIVIFIITLFFKIFRCTYFCSN